jgi:hypothetical protein
MADLVRYTCPRELLPFIEAALATNGYTVVESSLREDDNMLVVMRCGAVQVLLASCPGSDVADIEVWRAAACAAVQFLETLPFGLTRCTCAPH